MVSEVKYAAKLLGESCGKHGTYTFYPGILFTHKNKSRTIKLGEAFFLSLPVLSDNSDQDNNEKCGNQHENNNNNNSQNKDNNNNKIINNNTKIENKETNAENHTQTTSDKPNSDTLLRKKVNKGLIKYFQVLGELQLVWKDKNHEGEELVSIKIYLKPQDTPEGRLSSHGKDELVTVETKVVLRLGELVGHIIKTESLHHRHYHYLQRIHYRQKQFYNLKRHQFPPPNIIPPNPQVNTDFKNGISKDLKSACVALKEKSNVIGNFSTDLAASHNSPDGRVCKNKTEPNIDFASKVDSFQSNVDVKGTRRFVSKADDGALCVLKDEASESKENKLVLNNHQESLKESSTNKIKQEATEENHKRVLIPCRHSMKKPLVLTYPQYCRLKTAFKRIETMFDFEKLRKAPCEAEQKCQNVKNEDVINNKNEDVAVNKNEDVSNNKNENVTNNENKNNTTDKKEDLTNDKKGTVANEEVIYKVNLEKTSTNADKLDHGLKESLLHHYISYLMGSSFMTSLPDTFTNVQFFFSRDIVANADHLNIIKNDLSYLAPRLKGRKRKKKSYSRYFESDDSNESEFFNDYIITRNSNYNLNNNNNSNSSCNSNRSLRNSPTSLSIQKTPPMKKKKIETDKNIENGRELFLKHLHSFMEENMSPISKNPTLGFKQVDLYQLYTSTQTRGGYEQVTKKKLWKDVYDDLGGASGNTSAATVTRKHYERYLQPFEKHLKSGSANVPNLTASPSPQNNRAKRMVRSKNEAEKNVIKTTSEQSSPMLKLNFNKEAFIVIRPVSSQDQDSNSAKSIEYSKDDEVQISDKVNDNSNSLASNFATSSLPQEITTEISLETSQSTSAASNTCLKQSQTILQAPSSKLPIKNFFLESPSQPGNKAPLYSGKRTRSKKIFQLIQPASSDNNNNYTNTNKIDNLQNLQHNFDKSNGILDDKSTTDHLCGDLPSVGPTLVTPADKNCLTYDKKDEVSLDSCMKSSSSLPPYISSNTSPLLSCNMATSSVDSHQSRHVNGFSKSDLSKNTNEKGDESVVVASNITKVPKKVENLMNYSDTASLNSHSFYQNNTQNIKNRPKSHLINDSYNQKPISSYLDLYNNHQGEDMPADMSMKTLNKLQETINSLQNEPLDLSTTKKNKLAEVTTSEKNHNCNYLPIDLTKTNSSDDYFPTNFQAFPTSNYPPSSLPLFLPPSSHPTLPIDLTQLLLTVQINSSGTPILSSIQQNINMIYNPGPISFPFVNSTNVTSALNNNASNYP